MVPDPFQKYLSFGEHNNEMLKKFLNQFNFKYNFKSSTELYKSGYFNDALKLVLNNYKEIMNIIIPTLGKERQKTYSPFLPICPDTGVVLEIPVLELDNKNSKIIFDNKGKKLEQSILDGNCKLQWKVDWAMRWYALDVDFEMYGKDLIESAILSTKIIKLLGKSNPSGFAYELFLDEKGEKISKSKGNGITIDQWLEYASPESLSLYMYQNPKRAKKLYREVVPKAVDEYLDFIEKGKTQNELQKLMNPVWHVHNSEIPEENSIMSFSMLLNLASVASSDNKEGLWGFIKRYAPDSSPEKNPQLDEAAGFAVKYFRDFVAPTRIFRKPSDKERLALQDLASRLGSWDDSIDAELLQTLVFSVGKDHHFDPLRDWFRAIYEVIFGASQGPRFGGFIALYGIDSTISLINTALNESSEI